MKIPADVLELHEAAKRCGTTWGALRKAIYRKRLNGFKLGLSWFTTRSDVKRYMECRDVDKIPKRYRKKA